MFMLEPRRICAAVITLVAFAAHGAESLPPQAAKIRALLRTHQVDAAMTQAEAWTKSDANDTAAWFWAGRVYAQQAENAGMLTMASWAGKMRRALEHAIELDGSNVEARYNLLQFYAMAPGLLGGGRDKAQQQAQEIGKLDAARGHDALGIVAESADDNAAAEREYRAGLAAAPDDAHVRRNLALLLCEQKRWADARELYRELLGRHPDDAMGLYQAGRIAALSGEELEPALADLERLLALPDADLPDDVSVGAAHWRKGQILEKLGRKDAALAEVRLGVQLDPQLGEAKKDLKRLGG